MSLLASQPPDLLAISKISAQLDAPIKALIAGLEIHQQIDSTNRYLLDCARQGARSGTVCLAEQQTAGRGRRGRTWVSPFASNVYLSILWRFAQGYAAINGLSLAMGVAVVRALHALAIKDVLLKWPNDIYYANKKLGGILIEVTGENDGACTAVIGLGLNVAVPDAEAGAIDQAWTDLSRITGQAFTDRNRLVAELLNQLLAILASFETHGLSAYLAEWRRYDALKDQPASLWLGENQLSGIVRGIDDTGLLLLESANGSLGSYASGDVSFSGR